MRAQPRALTIPRSYFNRVYGRSCLTATPFFYIWFLMKTIFICFAFLVFIFDAIAAEKSSEELVEAAEQGNLQKVRSLIHAGADLNAPDPKEGLTPLIAAVQYGHTAIVEALIKAGADLNRKDELNQSTPLMWAVRKSESEEGKVTAPIEKKYDIAKLLIQSGADIHLKNRWGSTALQWAADSGNLLMVQALIERGADVNAGDDDGLTPLMVAANYEGETYLKMVQTMIKAGAKVNAQDVFGLTALMKAAMNHFKTGTVRFLVSSGAEIDSKTKEGYTALMLACKTARTEIIKFLIDAGADLQARTNNGDSVMTVAKHAGYKDVIAILKKAGAREITPTAMSNEGTIEGRVNIGPLRPGPVRQNEPPPDTTKLFSAHKIVILSEDGNKVVQEVSLDAVGNYKVSLPPGKYRVDFRPHDIGIGMRLFQPQMVTVEAGQTTRHDIYIDTGMR